MDGHCSPTVIFEWAEEHAGFVVFILLCVILGCGVFVLDPGSVEKDCKVACAPNAYIVSKDNFCSAVVNGQTVWLHTGIHLD